MVWGLFDGSRTLGNSCKLQTLSLASRVTEIPHTQGGQTLPGDVRVEDGGSFYRVVPLPTHTAPLLVHSPPLLAMSEEAVNLLIRHSTLNPCAPRGTAHIWVSSHWGQVCPPRAHSPSGTSRGRDPPGILGLGEAGPSCFCPGGPTPRGIKEGTCL